MNALILGIVFFAFFLVLLDYGKRALREGEESWAIFVFVGAGINFMGSLSWFLEYFMGG
jgi:hypothetical protein